MNPESFRDLHHADHRVRLAEVARAANRLADAPLELAELLDENLADPHREVRTAAAVALGDAAAREPAVLAQLAKAASFEETKDDKLRRRYRIAALVGLRRAGLVDGRCDGAAWDQARTSALGALVSPLPDVRYQAVLALTRLHAPPSVSDHVRPLLQDPDEEVVGQAAELLGMMGHPGDAPALFQASQRVSPSAARQVFLGLSQVLAGCGVEEHVDIRAQLLGRLEAEAGKVPHGIRACEALGRLGDPKAIPRLKALQDGWFTHRFLKVAAAAALVRLGDNDGATALGRFARSRHKDMRGFALERTGTLRLADQLDNLLNVLRSHKDYHSDTVALALGQWMKSLESAEPDRARIREALERASTDSRPEVRLEAKRALM